jgi:hypothetical protein
MITVVIKNGHHCQGFKLQKKRVIQTLEKTQRVFEEGIMKWRPGEGMIKSGVCIVRGMFSQRQVPEPTSYLCSSSQFTSLSNLLQSFFKVKTGASW